MRTSMLVVASVLCTTSALRAQGYSDTMIISLPEVEVRSGPTKKYYATSKLRQGDRVFVQHESKEPGWLAITPPPGSFSWISAKQVKQIDERTGYVDAEGGAAVVRPGSSISNAAPDVESAKIPNGSAVVILGKAVSSEGNTWLPIQAHITEVRFIPHEAVQTRQFASNKAQVPTGGIGAWTPVQAAGNPAQAAQGSPWVVGQTASFSSKPAAPALTYPPRWSQVGVLRRADSDKDGQPTYILQDARGNLLMYVTCLPGLTLRDYVGRTVAVFGALNYRSDDYMRTYFMTASHVAVY